MRIFEDDDDRVGFPQSAHNGSGSAFESRDYEHDEDSRPMAGTKFSDLADQWAIGN